MTRVARVGLGVVLVVGSAILGLKSNTAAWAANPIVSITPAHQTVPIGAGTVTYQVNIAAADNVAAYEFKLKFDPYVLEFVSARNGCLDPDPVAQCVSFLASSGRFPVCPGAVLSTANDIVRYGCATPGAYGGAGASGSGRLSTFTFKLVGGGTSSLEFIKLDLRDSEENDLCSGRPCTPQDTVGGSITVDGPVLARPTPDPNATPTPVGSAPAAGTTPASGTGAGNTQTSGTQPGAGGAPGTGSAGSSSSSGSGLSDSGASGSAGAPSGATAGADTQPGSTGARAGVAGASAGGNTGVGRFGDGPQSYARDGAGRYRNSAIVFAALGLVLMAAGVWEGAHEVRGVGKQRR